VGQPGRQWHAAGDGLPLSLTQRYFHDIILEEGFDPTWQHIPMAVETDRAFDAGRVAEVAAALEARHPLLAARLAYRDGEPRLYEAMGRTTAAVVLDLRDADRDDFEIRVSRAVDEPFDLLEGRLWRVVVALGSGGRSVLAFVCHHLVGDIISSWILLRDFGMRYFGGEFDPPPPEPYAAFAADQRAMRDDPPPAALAFWEEYLDGADPLLDVARRPGVGQLEGGEVVPLPFEPVEGDALVAQARATRVTPLAVLIANTMSGMRQATGQDDLVCGVVTDVRGSRFARTVGTFSELLFIRDRDGDAQRRLSALRNGFFAGWHHHMPVALLRERIGCFSDNGAVVPNPCDVFLNFVPFATSSNWLEMTAPYRDATLRFYPLRQRTMAPTRRMLGPLFFFLYVHETKLHGSVVVRRSEELSPLNRAVVDAVAGEIGALGHEPTASS
jgi:hypothetical protein